MMMPGDKFILRHWLQRILLAILVVFVVTTLTFFLMHLVPGDPYTTSIENISQQEREIYIKENGLDKPLCLQYLVFFKKILLKGDLGTSMINRTTTVCDILKSSLATSVCLGSIAVCMAVFIGFALGAVSSYLKDGLQKTFLSLLCVTGISLPVFVWAPLLQAYLGCKLRLFPISGWGTLSHLVLPVLCLLPNTLATTMKYTRNSIEKIRKSEYYIAIKQRGMGEWKIFRRHIIKNALPPIVTILVANLSGIFSGAFIVEKIFSIPGIGRQFMTAITMRDYTILIGLNIVFTIVYVCFRLLGDFAQERCNPLFREE